MSHKDYSGTPLYKKLGIKEGGRVAIVNAPDGFLLDPLPDGVQVLDRATKPLDVIVLFSDSRSHLGRRFEPLKEFLQPAGGFWIAYPKKSSAIETDLTFETVQRVGLDAGLVDNKSIAVDEDWSGVRFVYRLKDRPKER